MIHGPGSPGVFYNMPLGAERQLDWIGELVRHLEKHGQGAVEPTTDSEEAWGNEVSGIANATLFPRTDSWWTGANVRAAALLLRVPGWLDLLPAHCRRRGQGLRGLRVRARARRVALEASR